MLRPIIIARVFFILLATACGFWISHGSGNTTDSGDTAILAFICACIIIVFEYSLRTVSPKRVLLASIGLLFGLIVSLLVYETIPPTIMDKITSRSVCNFLFGYLGMIVSLKHADQINLNTFKFILSDSKGMSPLILDTSVIIDGRVEQMINSGFITGNIIVPQFVINELQTLADSADSLKRGKGRRGLNILESIQEIFPALQILEKEYPGIKEVDRLLIELAKEINGEVVTNDYNLQKVATLHKVEVLNINELADMLRPPVFVGESFSIIIMRDGKEQGQGVGYLGDGTMVVVDDSSKYLNNEIEIVVTSILQTNTGRMVFGKPAREVSLKSG